MLESEKEPKTTYNTQKSAGDQKEVLIENLIRCLSQEKNSSLEVDRLLNSSDLPPEEILQEAY